MLVTHCHGPLQLPKRLSPCSEHALGRLSSDGNSGFRLMATTRRITTHVELVGGGEQYWAVLGRESNTQSEITFLTRPHYVRHHRGAPVSSLV